MQTTQTCPTCRHPGYVPVRVTEERREGGFSRLVLTCEGREDVAKLKRTFPETVPYTLKVTPTPTGVILEPVAEAVEQPAPETAPKGFPPESLEQLRERGVMRGIKNAEQMDEPTLRAELAKRAKKT